MTGGFRLSRSQSGNRAGNALGCRNGRNVLESLLRTGGVGGLGDGTSESFLSTLAEYAREARQGDGRVVLVSGESGIGKPHCLRPFKQQVKGVRWL